MSVFSKMIRVYREKAGFKQNELGKLLSVSGKTVSAWETGRAEPSLEMIDKVAEVLNCSKAVLLGTDVEATDFFEIPFIDADHARKYIQSIPMISAIGNVNIHDLNDQDTIDFANEIIQLLKIASRSRT